MKKRGQTKILLCNFFPKNHGGQVLIETVIYTLIAMVLIGLVLAFARPKILELQDKAVLEQSLGMIKDIDNIILTMGGAGNQRLFEINLKSGSLTIDGEKNEMIFGMQSRYLYSEPGKTVKDGNILINTEKKGEINFVNFTRDYSTQYNITYGGMDQTKVISQSATAYKLLISNKGGDPQIIDFLLS